MAVLDEKFFKKLKEFLQEVWYLIKQSSLFGVLILAIIFILVLIQQIILSLFSEKP